MYLLHFPFRFQPENSDAVAPTLGSADADDDDDDDGEALDMDEFEAQGLTAETDDPVSKFKRCSQSPSLMTTRADPVLCFSVRLLHHGMVM